MNRRMLLLGALGAVAARWALAAPESLTPAQSRAVRAWMGHLISAQLSAGPSPRWRHRDCAGLVRFAVAEALREHDEKWRRANGMAGVPVPPEVRLEPAQQALRHRWRLADGTISAYAGALELIQENTRLEGRDCNVAGSGDLLFFDQGDAQHLMVWMGSFVAYHTGSESGADSGLRAVALGRLLRWSDTRWHPSAANPNFVGVYRFKFLSS